MFLGSQSALVGRPHPTLILTKSNFCLGSELPEAMPPRLVGDNHQSAMFVNADLFSKHSVPTTFVPASGTAGFNTSEGKWSCGW